MVGGALGQAELGGGEEAGGRWLLCKRRLYGGLRIQRNLDRLQIGAGRNLLKFRRGKCQALPLRRNTSVHQHWIARY